MSLPLAAAFLVVIALSGCGGNEAGSAEPTLGAERSQRGLVAALGDSITAGSPQWDPDQAVRDGLGQGVDPESQYEYWAQLRLPETRFRNCGVFGERTDEIAARLDDCVRGASTLIVQGGINDIAQGRAPEQAARNLRSMVVRGKRAKLGVLLTEVLPWNNGPPGAANQIRRVNGLIAKIGRDEEVDVLPWYRTLEDPQRRGAMKRELTIDGDHPSVAGYRRLGGTIALP